MRPLAVVILAGGGGTRFWPLSRPSLPKQLLDFHGRRRSLIEETVRRVLPLVGGRWDRIHVVATRALASGIRKALPRLRTGNLLLEPEGRNTAAAVTLAAARLSKGGGDPIMLVLPSDHHVPNGDGAAFRRCLASAARAADRQGLLVTLGIRPTRPETGYGYIRPGAPLMRIGKDTVHRVRSFVEKPPLRTAKRFLRSKEYLWNSGVFAWRTSTLLEEVRRYLPGHARAIASVAGGRPAPLERGYRKLPSIPIDKGVLERSDKVAVIPADFGWSDLGGYGSLHEVVGIDGEGNVARTRAFVPIESRGIVAWSPAKVVAVLGLEDVIIADTPGALLVAHKRRAQEVRRVVAEIQRRGLREVL